MSIKIHPTPRLGFQPQINLFLDSSISTRAFKKNLEIGQKYWPMNIMSLVSKMEKS